MDLSVFASNSLASHSNFTSVDCVRGGHNRNKHRGSVVLSMSLLKENDVSSTSELCSDVFRDLLDSIIIDVASESHRIARLGLDRKSDLKEEELRLSAEARARASDPSHSGEANGKYVVDIFGQTHPPIANEIFDCMNCGRSIMAGRFAPHLEKCMGKGRKARLKATRSTAASQIRQTQGSPLSAQPANINVSRVSNGSFGIAGDEYSNGTLDEP
ncbi:SAGA-associated factor 11-like isoform X1 [Primulina tabacum]|uniref:SAGA-associated factor 11-like isoform X1 n=2 Tax=Primulina tabacum TaxID=48773 RepID=UPI003F5A1C64